MDSQLVQFYKNQTIFLTGATGFLGQLFVEKLLRSCVDIKRLYLLVRAKKDKSPEERINDIFNGIIFERLKEEQPNFMEKVYLVDGDLEQDCLGLSNKDRNMLVNETNCVIHCAATIRFHEKIRKAVQINVKCVQDLIAMSKEMKNLKAFLYISTAYSNCIQNEIKEKFYEPVISPSKLFQLLDAVDDALLDKISPTLIGKYPNNYSFSKAIAESIINSEACNLPIGICRPSIVISTAKEPIPAWTNNIYGPAGFMLAGGLGILHTVIINEQCIGDMIPADYVVNCSLAALWEIAEEHKIGEYKKIKIYNCVSSPESPITFGNFLKLNIHWGYKVPFALAVWHKFVINCSTRTGYLVASFFLHTIPAHIADFVAMCIRKPQRFVKDFAKMEKFMNVFTYFMTNEWKFENINVQNLWKKLNDSDQKLFYFSMNNFDWNEYTKDYVFGLRVYLLKDPLETLPKSLAKQKMLKVVHYIFVAILVFCSILFLWIVLGFFV